MKCLKKTIMFPLSLLLARHLQFLQRFFFHSCIDSKSVYRVPALWEVPEVDDLEGAPVFKGRHRKGHDSVIVSSYRCASVCRPLQKANFLLSTGWERGSHLAAGDPKVSRFQCCAPAPLQGEPLVLGSLCMLG